MFMLFIFFPLLINLYLIYVLILFIDVHHGNYNQSRKVKSNMQEDSDGPMTRARETTTKGLDESNWND
jgi:hypothetical protein